ncbi:MAG: carbohydrate ABC transporter permease [Oscillospiraceae bacterium]|jgi:sn-glycerol 3-phosphate transport system permease protein
MKRKSDAFNTIVSILLVIIVIFPIIYCFCTSFKDHSELSSPTLFPESFLNFDNYVDAFRKAPLLRYMLNSLIVAVLGTALRLLVSIPAAYVFAFFDFKGKDFLFFLILGTMMMPGDILLVTNYVTVSRLGLLNSYIGICIVSLVSASEIFMLRQSFMSIPRSIIYASRIDGCSDLFCLAKIVCPYSRSTITVLAMQSFIALWNSYLWPLIVTASSPDMRTIMVGITKLNSWEDTNYELVMAGVSVSLVVSIVLFIVMRVRMYTKGVDSMQAA